MAIEGKAIPCLARVVAGVLTLCVGLPAHSWAEPQNPNAKAVTGGTSSKAAPRYTGSRSLDAQGRQWTIYDALPSNSSALSRHDSAPRDKAAIGRIPWQSGSLGFETETKLKSTESPDGQRLPSIESGVTRQTPSYLGLSLSLPTNQ